MCVQNDIHWWWGEKLVCRIVVLIDVFVVIMAVRVLKAFRVLFWYIKTRTGIAAMHEQWTDTNYYSDETDNENADQ